MGLRPGSLITLGTSPEVIREEGLPEEPAPWEDGLRIETGPGNFEWWYFDAQFEDGSTAVIVFATKPFTNPGDPLTPSLQITIVRPDGRKQITSPFFTQEDFHASREGCDVRMATNWVRGDLRRYELHVFNVDEDRPIHEGLGADLVFTGIVPAWRPGVGKNYYGAGRRKYFGWLPAVPYGQVEGSLTYDGKTHAVKGVGYHDHNWGNISLERVMRHWVWGRAHLGDFTTIFVEMTSAPEYGSQKIPIFLLAQGSRILTGDGSPLALSTSDPMKHPSRREYPTKLDLSWQDPTGSVRLALRRPKVIEAISLLFYLPPWQKNLVQFFANPYYFRFQADLELQVDLAGVHARESGPAIYELMMLR